MGESDGAREQRQNTSDLHRRSLHRLKTPRAILAIETSNPSAWTEASRSRPGVAVGLIDGPRLLAVEPLDLSKPHDDDLMPSVDRAVRRAGLTPRDLGLVAVSIGPGGYTAVRVAVTTARAIAEAVGARCVGVPSAEVVAARVRAGSRFAVVLASKDQTAYATVFDESGRPVHAGLVSAESAGELGVARVIADRFLPAGIRGALEAAGVVIDAPEFDPVALMELAVARPTLDPAELTPVYPREPEAVTKWRHRFPAR